MVDGLTSLVAAVSLTAALVQARSSTPGAAVSGRVLESGTGAPIAGAQVMLMPQRAATPAYPFIARPLVTSTDRDGRYEFDELDAGRYRFVVRRPGYALASGAPLAELSVRPGERRTGLDMVLQKGGVIVGRVLDPSGEPLADVRVIAFHPRSRAGQRAVLIAGESAETNDLGEFRLFSLPPGTYRVLATPPSAIASSARGTTLLPTYFPAATDHEAAEPVAVAAGQTSSEIVIQMVGAAAFEVSGVVTDDAGRPVVNAMVRLMPEESNVPFMMGRLPPSRTDTSGRFTISGVTGGTYVLTAVAPVVIARTGHASSRGTIIRGFVSGTIGGGVVTETNSNGTTIQYRDDTASRVPITIDHENVVGLAVVVRAAAR